MITLEEIANDLVHRKVLFVRDFTNLAVHNIEEHGHQSFGMAILVKSKYGKMYKFQVQISPHHEENPHP